MAKTPGNAVFAALADPTRRGILEAVSERGPVTATSLAGDLPISRQAVAKHLGLLADAGLVEADQVGRETRFVARPEPLDELVTWARETGRLWGERLGRLRALAEERDRPGSSSREPA